MSSLFQTQLIAEESSQEEKATFAGGCFWCLIHPFDQLDGVISVTSGYTGGSVPEPTYEQVSSGKTGHVEAIQIDYDPRRVSYKELLDVYWHNIDPTDAGGQFCDRGAQYRSVIYTHNEEQKKWAEESKQIILKKELVDNVETEIKAAEPFYLAEEYHQDYYKKNPIRYRFYRYACGRDKRLSDVWKTNESIWE